MVMKFKHPNTYESNEHINILAMPKTEYQGDDFFKRSEFRGLLLADYQNAIGPKAMDFVQQLNSGTVSQFSYIPTFKDGLMQS